MNSNHQRTQYLFLSAICLALIIIAACTSKPGAKTKESSETTASDSVGSHIDAMCVGERINNPPEPFHFSYKYSNVSSSSVKDADITPQAMDITIKDQSGSHSFHGVHSDEASWARAVVDLSSLNMTGMMSRLDSLNETSAISQQTTEPMNGYDTTRYAIDTTKANSSDQRKLEFLFGAGSFEKGTVWASSDGCAVKLVLDERVLLGGNLKDAHYELAMVRK